MAELQYAKEAYRPVAARGGLMYFLITSIHQLDRVYHYSMANFLLALEKGKSILPKLTGDNCFCFICCNSAVVPKQQVHGLYSQYFCINNILHVERGLNRGYSSGMNSTPQPDQEGDVDQRVILMIQETTLVVFQYISQASPVSRRCCKKTSSSAAISMDPHYVVPHLHVTMCCGFYPTQRDDTYW